MCVFHDFLHKKMIKCLWRKINNNKQFFKLFLEFAFCCCNVCGAGVIWNWCKFDKRPWTLCRYRYTVFLWDCLVRWLETNDFTMIGWANKHQGELAYIRKHTRCSSTTMITSWNLWNYLLPCIKICHQQVENNEFINSGGNYPHLDGTRPFPYTLKRSVYWSPCSLNYCLVHSGEFHPNNLQYNPEGQQTPFRLSQPPIGNNALQNPFKY